MNSLQPKLGLAGGSSRTKRIYFITGTDTGSGKTLLTGLLLAHLRRRGVRALAIKPFCSGGRSDVRFLMSLQPGELAETEVNPFYYPEAVAPAVSAEKHGRNVDLRQVLDYICEIHYRCDVLLVEGSGGLLVPLGRDFTVRDLIAGLSCEVIVAARNRLGVINHSLLTLEALEKARPRSVKLVLMGERGRSLAIRTNGSVLSQVAHVKVFAIPFLGESATTGASVKKKLIFFQKTLAEILV